MSHWFDGFSTTRKVDLIPSGDGKSSSKVLYASYSKVDELVEDARKTGQLVGTTFGPKRDVCESLCKKLKTVLLPLLAGGPPVRNMEVTLRTYLTFGSFFIRNGEESKAPHAHNILSSEESISMQRPWNPWQSRTRIPCILL